ncbi:MAG TPA: VanZ family protein [Bacilli bacterium]
MKKVLFLFFSGLWLGVIFFNSLQIPEAQKNYQEITTSFAKLFDFLKIESDLKIVRSILNIGAHMFEFFFLAIFLCGFFCGFKLHYPYYIAFTVAFFLGLIDESLQGFVPGRVSSVGDIFVDLIGAGFGALSVYIVNRLSALAFKRQIIRNLFLQKP